ncbi:hypothetical protein GCM10023178_29330 [Actinomadura luteofluorescens]
MLYTALRDSWEEARAVATEAMAVGGRTDAGRIGRGDRHGKGCESVGPRKAGLGRVAER